MSNASSASRTCRAPRSHSEYTATGETPISRQALMMRTAISPRLAIRIFMKPLERDVPVLLRGVPVPFRLERGQRRDEPGTRLPRMDHRIHEAAGRGDER